MRESVHEGSEFVLATDVHGLRQVAVGDGGGQALGFTKRLANALHVGQRGGHHDERSQRHGHTKDQQGLGVDVFLLLLQGRGFGLEDVFRAFETAQNAGVLLVRARQHAVGDGGGVVTVVGQLACHGFHGCGVGCELVLHLTHDDVVIVLLAHKHVVHLLQCRVARRLPLGLGLGHLLGLLVRNDHVLLEAAHVAQRDLQAGQGQRLLKSVINKLHAQGMQAVHAPQASPADHGEQKQHDGNGAHHSGADGKLAHQSLHGRVSLWKRLDGVGAP